MKPWFRKSCNWHRSAQVDALRSLLGQQAPLALVILDSIYAWCAEDNTSSISAPSVDREVRNWTTNAALGRRLLDALVGVELLREGGEGYSIDLTLIQRSEEGEPPPSSRRSSRQERYRQAHADAIKEKDRARKASRKVSPAVAEGVTESVAERHGRRHGTSRNGVTESVTDSTTPVSEGVTESSNSATNPAPPPPGPPTPAQAQTQAQAQVSPPSPPPGGKAQGVPEESPLDPPPSASPSREAYLAAYVAGISAVTKLPCPPPTAKADLEALGLAIRTCALDAHKKPLRGKALLAWLTDNATAYASAKIAAPQFERGFAPSKFVEWLRSGRPEASAPASAARPSRTAPRQPAVPSRYDDPECPWKPAIDLESFAAEEAAKAAAGAPR